MWEHPWPFGSVFWGSLFTILCYHGWLKNWLVVYSFDNFDSMYIDELKFEDMNRGHIWFKQRMVGDDDLFARLDINLYKTNLLCCRSPCISATLPIFRRYADPLTYSSLHGVHLKWNDLCIVKTTCRSGKSLLDFVVDTRMPLRSNKLIYPNPVYFI